MSLRTFWAIMALTMFMALFVLLAAEKARAHSFYDGDCCSLIDCKPVPDGTVVENTRTGAVTVLGQTLPHGDARLRRSRDDQDHVCANVSTGKLLCVYLRPKGM